MEQPSREALEKGRAYVERRQQRLAYLIQRKLETPAESGDLTEERRRFLLEEAQELYWNELSWEQVTDEEGLGEAGLVELTFPGFLAFVEGLLLREVMPDSLAPAHPRPEVVGDILAFLGARCVELEGSGDGDAAVEREVTARLIDLVLYRLHEVPVEEVEWLEEEASTTDGE